MLELVLPVLVAVEKAGGEERREDSPKFFRSVQISVMVVQEAVAFILKPSLTIFFGGGGFSEM